MEEFMNMHFSLVNGRKSDPWHEILEEVMKPYGTLEIVQESEAVSKLIEMNYDATILDANALKELELELLISRLCTQRPETRVVVAAENPSWGYAKKMIQAGAIDCIPRSNQKADMQKMLANVLSKPSPPRRWLTPRGDSSMTGIAILVADNQTSYLMTLRELIEDEGYIVLPAVNPTEAKRILEREEVSLAIIDLRLENDENDNDMSGLKLAKEVAPSVSKVILTLHPDYESLRNALVPGPDGRRVAIDFIYKKEEGADDSILDAVRKAVELSEERRVEQTIFFPRQRGRMFATVALLLAIGAGILAIATGDPRWLLATILLVISVVFFIGLFVK